MHYVSIILLLLLFMSVFRLFEYYVSHLVARTRSARRHWSMCILYTAYQTVEFNCTTGYWRFCSVEIWHCSLICAIIVFYWSNVVRLNFSVAHVTCPTHLLVPLTKRDKFPSNAASFSISILLKRNPEDELVKKKLKCWKLDSN